MKKHFILLITLLFFYFIYSNKIRHLQINFDFSNIRKEEKEIRRLQQEILIAGKFLSELIFSENEGGIFFNKIQITNCDKNIQNFELQDVSYPYLDLLVFPYFIENENNKYEIFKGIICDYSEKNVPNLAVLEINENIFKRFFYKNKDYFRMSLLKSLTNILGFEKSILLNLGISNAYYELPEYFTNEYFYSKSIKKYHKFTGVEMPKKIEGKDSRENYLSYWYKKIQINDYMKTIIKKDTSITELTINLLRDLPFYHFNKCDFEMYHDICYRFDNNCFTHEQIENNYFVEFHLLSSIEDIIGNDIYIDEEENIVKCYLNTKENLKLRQCGTIEGNLVNDIVEEKYCINYDFIEKNNFYHNKYYIPELNLIDKQALFLVTPSESCPKKHPRTIFFRPVRYENEKDNIELERSLKIHEIKEREKYKIEKVILKDKNYFATFKTYTGYKLTVNTLIYNGLIRSYLHNGNHNLIAVPPDKLNLSMLEKYQFVYRRMGSYFLSNKYQLYLSFESMKKLFPEDYDYMPKTYSFPEDYNKIIQKFSNYNFKESDIWLIKPKNSSQGRGIHIFQSLKEEKGSYLLTKYIENPHLINGKKYDFRIYALITSVRPLSIYLYNQGLVRIASDEFSLSKEKISSSFVHLTHLSGFFICF